MSLTPLSASGLCDAVIIMPVGAPVSLDLATISSAHLHSTLVFSGWHQHLAGGKLSSMAART